MNTFRLIGISIAALIMLTACSYGLGSAGGSEPQGTLSQKPESAAQSVPAYDESIPQDTPESSDKDTKGEEEAPLPADNSDWRLILVNRNNPLPEGFTVELEETIGSYKFDVRAADDLRAFMKAAKSNGVSLSVISTFRKQSTQERLYAEKVAQYVNAGYSNADAKNEAARWVAIPGTSEHQSGLAVDVVSADWYSKNDDLYDTFENTDEFKWLIQNCVQYGFVLRYAKDKQDITGITYEPWHYRFVGVENARYMTEHNLCLEEYVALLNG